MRWLLAAGTVVVSLGTVGAASAGEPCPVIPTAGSTAGSADELYAKAREAFEGKRFAEAAPLFAVVALEHAQSEVAPYAASLSLESFNSIGASCVPVMGELSHRLRSQFCTAAAAPKHEELCATTARVASDLQRLEAQELVKQADASAGEAARKLYLRAGTAYESLWQSAYAEPCTKGLPACARAEEVLYNAARAFSAGHDAAKAAQLRDVLIDPTFHLHQTALGLRALYEQGAASQALAEHSKAAEWYERFALASPKDEKAPTALLDAVVLRLGLHDWKQAAKDGELWEKSYAPKRPSDHAKLVLALGQSLAERGEWKELEAYVPGRRAAVLKGQPLQEPEVDVLWAKALAGQGKVAEARKLFERAASSKAPLQATDVDDLAEQRMLGRALTAMGEARLWLARQLRDEALALKVKKGDVESLTKKRAAVALAEAEYQKVVALQPAPPPRPSVAAVADVARMKGQLWAQAHLALGADAADPLLREAKAAYRACVELGAKLEVAAPGCGAWLEKHFPEETPRNDGLVPPPTRFGVTATPPPRPLDQAEEEVVRRAP